MVSHCSTDRLGFTSLVAIGILCSCAPSPGGITEVNASPLPLVEQAHFQSLCEPDEIVAFSGDVQDDFGLTISVCLEQDSSEDVRTLSVRSEGEGGGNVVSCKRGDCDGILEFDHYRRYRFSILTLTWFHDGHRQQLVESYNAEDLSQEPVHSVTHSWLTETAKARGIEAHDFPVVPATEPMSLLLLEDIFEQ